MGRLCPQRQVGEFFLQSCGMIDGIEQLFSEQREWLDEFWERSDIELRGDDRAMEIRNVVSVEELHSTNGIHVVTRQNNIWIDASHVSAMWQARTDLDTDLGDDYIPSSHNRVTAV